MFKNIMRYLTKAALAVVVVVVLFSIVSWFRTKRDLARYCRETTAGTTLVMARKNAQQYGFRFVDSSSAGHRAYVLAAGVMGRYVCEIEHDGKRVVTTTLNFND
jgi:biopolymer transport protein ExbB/TolQ